MCNCLSYVSIFGPNSTRSSSDQMLAADQPQVDFVSLPPHLFLGDHQKLQRMASGNKQMTDHLDRKHTWKIRTWNLAKLPRWLQQGFIIPAINHPLSVRSPDNFFHDIFHVVFCFGLFFGEESAGGGVGNHVCSFLPTFTCIYFHRFRSWIPVLIFHKKATI